MRGKTISIYIPDGNVKSIKICDMKDSIVKAIMIPRTKLMDVTNRKELQEPGVYFLFGEVNDIGKHKVYIGEAETLISRLRQHNISKDFRNTAICFVSEKGNINKAHIKYLELYCCAQAKSINKCELENTLTPTQSSLTEQDEDFVLSFFDDMRILISALGFPVFEETKRESKNILFCKGKGALAQGELNEDGSITIFKGSQSIVEEAPATGNRIISMRKRLLENGILKNDGLYLVFTEDYVCSSLSAAAGVILARGANGRTERKNQEGKTAKDLYRN